MAESWAKGSITLHVPYVTPEKKKKKKGHCATAAKLPLL